MAMNFTPPDIQQAGEQARILQLLQAAGYKAQPEAPPQLAPSPGLQLGPFHVGGGTLDELSSAVLRNPPPGNMRGAAGVAGGFAQGFARARAGRAQARSQAFEGAARGVADRNEARQKFLEKSIGEQEQERNIRTRLSAEKAAPKMGEAYLLVDTPEKEAALIKQFPHMKGKIPFDKIVYRSELYNNPADNAAKEKIATDKEKRADARNERLALMSMNTAIKTDPDVGDFVVVRNQWKDGDNALKSRTSYGDLIAMRSLARASDPRTGIREEEFRTFKDAVGALNARGIYITQEMWGRGMLNDVGRAHVKARLDDIYKNRRLTYRNAIDQFRNQAATIGVDPEKLRSFEPTEYKMPEDEPEPGEAEDPFAPVQAKADSTKRRPR